MARRPEQGIPKQVVRQPAVAADGTPTEDGQPSGMFDMQRVIGHAARQGIGPAARAIDDRHGHPTEETRIEEFEVPPASVGIQPEIHRVPELDFGLKHPGEGPARLASRSDQDVSPDIAQGIPQGAESARGHLDLHEGGQAVYIGLRPTFAEGVLRLEVPDVPGGEHHDALTGMVPGHVLREMGHGAALLREGIEHARRVHHERSPEVGQDQVDRLGDTGPGAHRLKGRAPERPHHQVHRATIKGEILGGTEHDPRRVQSGIEEPHLHMGTEPPARIQGEADAGGAIQRDVPQPFRLTAQTVLARREWQQNRHPDGVARPVRGNRAPPRCFLEGGVMGQHRRPLVLRGRQRIRLHGSHRVHGWGIGRRGRQGAGNPQHIPLADAAFRPPVQLEETVEVDPVPLGDAVGGLLALHGVGALPGLGPGEGRPQAQEAQRPAETRTTHSHSMVAGGLEEMS